MLQRATSFADLAQLAHTAIGQGTNSLSHPFSLVDLVLADASGWTLGPGGRWQNDFVPEAVQLARLTHAEMAADRFCRQMSSVFTALLGAADPHWAAITCYYAAFYGAQALLFQSGRGIVRVPADPSLAFRGIYAVSSTASTSAAGRVTVSLSRVGAGSHRATWEQAHALLDEMLINETDSRAIVILRTLQSEITSPVWLSEARNEINYDLTSSPVGAPLWSSLLLDLDDCDRVEEELARSSQLQPERRFEIVALAFGCLSTQLRAEFRRRGGRLDRRQLRARERMLPDHDWLYAS